MDFVTPQDADRRIGRALRVLLKDAEQAGYLAAARDLADQLDPPPPPPGGSAITRGRSLGSLTPPASKSHTPKSPGVLPGEETVSARGRVLELRLLAFAPWVLKDFDGEDPRIVLTVDEGRVGALQLMLETTLEMLARDRERDV